MMPLEEYAIFPASVSIQKNRMSLKPSELRLLTSNLSRMVAGGVPLMRAVEILSAQLEREEAKRAVEKMADSIREGRTLSESLEPLTSSLPSHYQPMVRAGELSGSLAEVLGTLTVHLDKERERNQKMIEALAYPAFVLLSGLATLLVLMNAVIPKILSIYADYDTGLPWMTRCVLFLTHHLHWILLAAAGFFLLCAWIFTRFGDTVSVWSLKIPFLGPLVRSHHLVRFTGLLSLLLRGGMPLLQGLDVLLQSPGNSAFQKDLKRLREKLIQGSAFSQALNGIAWIPGTTQALLAAGEETGDLVPALSSVSRDAQSDFDSRLVFLMKILEPLVILAVGLVVSFLVISTLLPIFELNVLVQ